MSSSRSLPSPIRRPKSQSTTRRLIKVASLGIAGLIAGLLAGCSASSLHLFRSSQPAPEPTLTASRRIENLDTRRIPALHHAPVPHYTQPAPQDSRRANALLGGTGTAQPVTARYPVTRYNPDSFEISEP